MPPPTSWDLAWEQIGAVVVVAAAYVLAARRHPPSRLRMAVFAAGLALVLAVFVTPVGTLALHYLLAAHLFQNVALAEWAPALVVLGLSAGMAAALTRPRPLRLLTLPAVALPLWLVVYGVWHVPAVYDAALRSRPLLLLEHVTYVAAGVLLWWPVFRAEPRRLGNAGRAAYVFGAFLLASPIGLLLALVPRPIYDFYVEAPRVWGLDAATDQQIAGVIMAGSEAVVFFAVFAVYFLRFLADEERG